MKESTLLRIALSFSLLGLVALFIIARTIEPDEVNIGNLSVAEESRIVRVKGVISGFRDSGNTARIEIAQPETVEVFLFKSRNLSLQKGQFVEVTGEISEYNGKKELMASEISVLG